MNPVEAVAQAITAHELSYGTGNCRCQKWELGTTHAEHVAAAVLASLELREEWAVESDGGVFATWHKTRKQAEGHCETIRGNWRRVFRVLGHDEPTPIPVHRLVTPWQPIGEEKQ